MIDRMAEILEEKKVEGPKLPLVFMIATTPFAVNAFLENHITTLSRHYKIIVLTNLLAYELAPKILSKVEVRHINFSRKISFLSDIKTLLKLTLLFCKFRPSVIHSITPKAGLLAIAAAFISRTPNRWHTFTGQVWVTREGLIRHILKGLDKLIVSMATRVFADSLSQCRHLENEGVVRIGQISVLGPGSIAGVDLNRFHIDAVHYEDLRHQMGIHANVTVFLFVGRLARDKGVFDLIQAFLKLASEVHDIELWAVGPDEEGLQKKLQKLAEGSHMPIRWLGKTSSPEYFMSAADVLLLPSYREGFGSVIIEAAACGIPSVAYSVDGVVDAIEDGVTGLLVEVAQYEAFALAMKRLALNKGLRKNLGESAKDRVISSFSNEIVTKVWLEFYLSQTSEDNKAC